jgi:hypothetical protein
VARSPIPLLTAASAAGVVALALSPLSALAVAGALVIGGAAVRARRSRSTGLGLMATGGALFLACVLLLVLVEADQDEPVILGPDTGLTPGG